jgi:hypothetical protein
MGRTFLRSGSGPALECRSGAVDERLGHDDATLVLSTYGHLMPGSGDRTRKAIDAAWDPVSDDSGEAGTAPGRPR